jgi:hypothetical protein
MTPFHGLDEQAVVGVAWLNGGTAFTTVAGGGGGIESETMLLLGGAMALAAAVAQERFDLFQVIDRRSRKGASRQAPNSGAGNAKCE